jgi:hypothetical protein
MRFQGTADVVLLGALVVGVVRTVWCATVWFSRVCVTFLACIAVLAHLSKARTRRDGRASV